MFKLKTYSPIINEFIVTELSASGKKGPDLSKNPIRAKNYFTENFSADDCGKHIDAMLLFNGRTTLVYIGNTGKQDRIIYFWAAKNFVDPKSIENRQIEMYNEILSCIERSKPTRN